MKKFYKKLLPLLIFAFCFILMGCVDDMFKDIYNLIYDEGKYWCYVDTPDESNIAYIEVEILEISEYEASQFNNSFKQNLKYVTGENKDRYLKANMLLIYTNGEEEIVNLSSVKYPEQYDTIIFDAINTEKINSVKIRFSYNGSLATDKYEGKYSNGLEVLLSIGSTTLYKHSYDLSNFETYHTHGIHKGNYTRDITASEQSTCLKEGYQQVKCRECDYEIVERFPLVTHKYENEKCIWCHSKKYPAHYFYASYEDREEIVKIITSTEELQQYFDSSKNEITDTYNNAYFENKSLVYLSYWTSSSVEYNVTKIEVVNGIMNVNLDITSPSNQNDDYLLMNILAEVDYKATPNTELNIIENFIGLKDGQTLDR